jgi:DNA gyrase subunit A
MPLMDILHAFIAHRREVVRRRLEFEVAKARKRAHVLEGLAVAISNLDDVIALIRNAAGPAEAKAALLAQQWSMQNFPITNLERDLLYVADLYGEYGASDHGYWLSETQAQAILDLRLHRITGLERSKILDEFTVVVEKIRELLAILGDYARFMQLIRSELLDVKLRFATPRRTEINDHVADLDDLDLIADEPVVVTRTKEGYLKSQKISEYKVQRRGGKGKSASQTKEDDVIASLCVATMHEDLLCFTNLGRVYKLPVRKIPLSSRIAKGRPANNFLPLQDNEHIQQILPVRDFTLAQNCILATKQGVVKNVPLSAFANIRVSGIIAMNLRPEDSVVGAVLVDASQDVMLFSCAGKAIRFSIDDIRETGRTSQGVIGIRMKPEQRVISLLAVRDDQTVLLVSEKGYGKRTPVSDFNRIGRGGQGVIAMITNARNGLVSGVVLIDDADEFFLITHQGAIIRMHANAVSRVGRNTQGVRLIQLADADAVVGCQKLDVQYGFGESEEAVHQQVQKEDAEGGVATDQRSEAVVDDA